jgi:hypothetical protein
VGSSLLSADRAACALIAEAPARTERVCAQVFENLIRVIGTLKTGPDLNVLAIYQK